MGRKTNVQLALEKAEAEKKAQAAGMDSASLPEIGDAELEAQLPEIQADEPTTLANPKIITRKKAPAQEQPIQDASEMDTSDYSEDDTVEVEEELSPQETARQLRELRRAVLGEESALIQPQKRTPECFMRFFRDELDPDKEYPIVYFKDSRSKGDRLIANFIVLKNSKEELMSYDQVNLLNEMPRYHAKIIKEDWKKLPKHQGAHPTVITTQQQDPWGDAKEGIVHQARRIKLEEMSVTCTLTLLFTEGPLRGQKLKINSLGNAVNA